ncbi:MAG: capsule assembly Wzi family protein [bacterium]|nr:capsule assembly Wzi family protein [bacterium]
MSKITFFIIVLLINVSSVFGVYVPVEESTTETVEELKLRGFNLISSSDMKNYFIQKSAMDKAPDWLKSRITQPMVTIKSTKDSINHTKIRLFIPYEKPPFSMVVQPIIKLGNENIWPTAKFKDKFAADYERAFVKFDNSVFEAMLGRERFAMGPSTRYNLLLSGNAPSLDAFFMAYSGGRFKLSFLFSRLDNITDENLSFVGDTFHSDTLNARRFMSMRRLEYTPFKRLQIGLTEAVIYGGENAIPDLYYLNPVALSYPYEFIHRETDHNILWDIDMKINLNSFTVYGEFLMDDFQYGKDEQGEPNHIGGLVGIRGVDPLKMKKTFFQLEYIKISRWAYNHYHPWQRYEYQGYPLGYPSGPDVEELFAKFTFHAKPSFDLYASVTYTTKGSASINDTWPVAEAPRVEGNNFPANNFMLSPISHCLNITTGTSVIRNIHKWQLKIDTEVCELRTDKETIFGGNVNVSVNKR